MDSFVYHEIQESRLCGQHCLNNLIQEHYFTAESLREIANELDRSESRLSQGISATSVAAGAVSSSSGSVSENVDETGNFSIQVLAVALKRARGIDLEYSARPEALDPAQYMAFVVNYQSHWFAVRRIGDHWWNMDSMLKFPKLISAFHLTAYLQQLRTEGYSVFVVRGSLPFRGHRPSNMSSISSRFNWHKESHLLEANKRGDPAVAGGATNEFKAFSGKGVRLDGKSDTKLCEQKDSYPQDEREYEAMLAQAIQASLSASAAASTGSSSSSSAATRSAKDEIRAKRLAALERTSSKT